MNIGFLFSLTQRALTLEYFGVSKIVYNLNKYSTFIGLHSLPFGKVLHVYNYRNFEFFVFNIASLKTFKQLCVYVCVCECVYV